MRTPLPASARVETTASSKDIPATPKIDTQAVTKPEPAVAPQAPPAQPVAAGPCDACSGKVTSELQEALLKRAQASRGCYVRVVNAHPAARASLNVELRVGRDGSTCDATVQSEAPEWPGLADCVATEYRRGGLPRPEGNSCVIARVPILFTPEVK
jgi:hypothetical protein